MKHRRKGRKLSRIRKVRKGLIKSLLSGFFNAGRMETTLAKAKEIQPLIDRMINNAKKAKDKEKKASIVRQLRKDLPVSSIEGLIKKSLEELTSRSSGYTRIMRTGKIRKGDGAETAIIELVK